MRLSISNSRYEILDLLGKGGMGAVFLAKDTRLNILRAIKVLPTEMHKDSNLRQRFEAEALMMAQLLHPNTVTVFDFGQEEDLSFFIMELVDGGSVHRLIKSNGGLSIPQSTYIVLEALKALKAAHKRKVIHRDIKPDNILIAQNNQIKISDFGIASLQSTESRITKTGAMMGTIDYMPPEQRIDAYKASAQSDYYSLIASFYEMLTGNSPRNLHDKNCHSEMLSVLDFDTAHFIKKGTESDLKNRYQNAEEIIKAIEHLCSKLKITPQGEGLYQQPSDHLLNRNIDVDDLIENWTDLTGLGSNTLNGLTKSQPVQGNDEKSTSQTNTAGLQNSVKEEQTSTLINDYIGSILDEIIEPPEDQTLIPEHGGSSESAETLVPDPRILKAQSDPQLRKVDKPLPDAVNNENLALNKDPIEPKGQDLWDAWENSSRDKYVNSDEQDSAYTQHNDTFKEPEQTSNESTSAVNTVSLSSIYKTLPPPEQTNTAFKRDDMEPDRHKKDVNDPNSDLLPAYIPPSRSKPQKVDSKLWILGYITVALAAVLIILSLKNESTSVNPPTKVVTDTRKIEQKNAFKEAHKIQIREARTRVQVDPALVLTPRHQATRSFLKGFISQNALKIEQPWKLGHALLALGPETKLNPESKEDAVIELIQKHAQPETINDTQVLSFPEFANSDRSIPVEPHADLMLKVITELGISAERIVTVSGSEFTVGDLYRSSLLRSYMNPYTNKSSYKSTNDLPWSLQALTSWSPQHLSWTAENGEQMKLDDLTVFTAVVLSKETEDLQRAMYSGASFVKDGKGIFQYTCGGAHLLQGVLHAYANGFGNEKVGKILAIQNELHYYRFPIELQIYDDLMKMLPEKQTALLLQRLKFVGHFLETSAKLIALGEYPPRPEHQKMLLGAANQLTLTVEALRQENLFNSLQSSQLTNQQKLDIIGDASHALYGLDLISGSRVLYVH